MLLALNPGVFGINTSPIANNSVLTPFTHDTTVLRRGQQSSKLENNDTKKEKHSWFSHRRLNDEFKN